jgi:threonine dehydrogenase-like Zn-dependent dehydrogenase
MQALCLSDGVLGVRELEPPQPGPGEALLRVRMAGGCTTDLEIAKGYMGFAGVLGHELLATVESAADPRLLGKRVAGEINLACGRCETCARGLGRHCPARSVLGILRKDGCFAEYVTLPLSNLHVLPDALSDELACFVEPTAAAFEILEQRPIAPEERVVVLGDGKLGLLIAQVLATTGCALTLVGKHEPKLALARARGIATAALDELKRKSFDVVVEATGVAQGLRAAIELTRPRGTLVLKSTYHGALELDAAPLVIDELCVMGSRRGPFAPAIEALMERRVDPGAMIAASLPLRRGVEAFALASQPQTLKVLLDMREK